MSEKLNNFIGSKMPFIMVFLVGFSIFLLILPSIITLYKIETCNEIIIGNVKYMDYRPGGFGSYSINQVVLDNNIKYIISHEPLSININDIIVDCKGIYKKIKD